MAENDSKNYGGHYLDLDEIRLSYGAHDDRSKGVCLLEAVAWFAGEDHSDAPDCVSPVLATMGRSLNDHLLGREGRLDLEPRLRTMIPRLVGTANRPGPDKRAAIMAEDFLVRKVIPVLCRKTDDKDLNSYADRLEALSEITSWDRAPVKDLSAAADVAYAAARTATTAATTACRWAITRAAYTARDVYRYVPRAAADAGLYEEVVSLYQKMIDLYHEY